MFANTLSAGLAEATALAKAEAKAEKAAAKAEAGGTKAATRHQRAGYAAEASTWEVAQTIRLNIDAPSCSRYLLFVALFTVCALSIRDASYGFWYQHMLRETMLRTEFKLRDTVVERTFESIQSVSHVWHFLQGPFLSSLYNEVSYSGEPLHPRQHLRVLGVSRVVGPIRIQQVRVRDNGCSVPSQFSDPDSPVYIPHCYSEWSTGSAAVERRPLLGYDARAECEAPHGEPSNAQLRACNASASHGAVRSYVHSDAAATGQSPFDGWFGSYGGGGYFVDLPDAQAEVRALLSRLEQDVFFDLRTRALWVDLTLYNANVNRFLVGRLLFERLEGGGVQASADLRSLHLLWYEGEGWLAQLLPECAPPMALCVLCGACGVCMDAAGRCRRRSTRTQAQTRAHTQALTLAPGACCCCCCCSMYSGSSMRCASVAAATLPRFGTGGTGRPLASWSPPPSAATSSSAVCARSSCSSSPHKAPSPTSVRSRSTQTQS